MVTLEEYAPGEGGGGGLLTCGRFNGSGHIPSKQRAASSFPSLWCRVATPAMIPQLYVPIIAPQVRCLFVEQNYINDVC